ncbi:MAG: hypothetical protein KKB38_21035 [Gammaproteobacteria bacterium]|nr:hypothetical protein [Gammaproteobacteria bacterium]
MGCYKYWEQFDEIEKGREVLLSAGIGPGHTAYEALWKERGAVLAKARAAAPSTRESPTVAHISVLGRLQALGLEYAAFSPQRAAEEFEETVITARFDIETGWFAEARMKPGDLPIYHQITAEEAISIIKGEPSYDLMARLLRAEEYVGE